MGQIKVTLDSAKELVSNGDSSKEKFDLIINKNFSSYLNHDQVNRQCNPLHKNYQKLKEMSRIIFISQVEQTILFFKVQKENIEDYNELTRETFKTKEKAYQALIRQLNYNEECIAIVEQDDSILKMFLGKNIILTVLRKSFELIKKNLVEDLDIIFN